MQVLIATKTLDAILKTGFHVIIVRTCIAGCGMAPSWLLPGLSEKLTRAHELGELLDMLGLYM